MTTGSVAAQDMQQHLDQLYDLRTRLAISRMALAESRRRMEAARAVLAREDGASWADAIEEADKILQAAIDHSRSREERAAQSQLTPVVLPPPAPDSEHTP